MEQDTLKSMWKDMNNTPKTILAGKPALRPNPNPDGLGTPYFTNYDTDQGLALSSIWCGYTDKKGNLWFGTINYGAASAH